MGKQLCCSKTDPFEFFYRSTKVCSSRECTVSRLEHKHPFVCFHQNVVLYAFFFRLESQKSSTDPFFIERTLPSTSYVLLFALDMAHVFLLKNTDNKMPPVLVVKKNVLPTIILFKSPLKFRLGSRIERKASTVFKKTTFRMPETSAHLARGSMRANTAPLATTSSDKRASEGPEYPRRQQHEGVLQTAGRSGHSAIAGFLFLFPSLSTLQGRRRLASTAALEVSAATHAGDGGNTSARVASTPRDSRSEADLSRTVRD